MRDRGRETELRDTGERDEDRAPRPEEDAAVGTEEPEAGRSPGLLSTEQAAPLSWYRCLLPALGGRRGRPGSGEPQPS